MYQEPAAEERWLNHVNEVAHATLYPEAGSWYMGANVPGKRRELLFHPGVPDYMARYYASAENGYEGFVCD